MRAQQTKTFVLRIDTLNTFDSSYTYFLKINFITHEDSFTGLEYYKNYLNKYRYISKYHYINFSVCNYKSHPSYISEGFTASDTSTLTLYISEFGYIEIKNLMKLNSNLIKIDRLDLISDDLGDTTYVYINWYKWSGDSLIFLKNKSHYKKVIHKSRLKSKSIKKTLSLTINGEKKIVPLSITTSNTWFSDNCGNKPRNPYRKDGQKKKNAKRLNIHTVKKSCHYKGVLIL